MGGSGSGGGSGGGRSGASIGKADGLGGSSEGSLSCDAVRLTATIMSPEIELISELRVGQVLDVRLNQKKLFVYVDNHSRPLGFLGDNAMFLVECIERGFEYKAIVLHIRALMVEVVVSSVE